jgi:hypothetical protein
VKTKGPTLVNNKFLNNCSPSHKYNVEDRLEWKTKKSKELRDF